MPVTKETIMFSSVAGYAGVKVTSQSPFMSMTLIELANDIVITPSDVGQLLMLSIGVATFVLQFKNRKKDQDKD